MDLDGLKVCLWSFENFYTSASVKLKFGSILITSKSELHRAISSANSPTSHLSDIIFSISVMEREKDRAQHETLGDAQTSQDIFYNAIIKAIGL